ncbi:hypothetical protein ACOSQ4_000689 [Xanthoceras sorbifolium]
MKSSLRAYSCLLPKNFQPLLVLSINCYWMYGSWSCTRNSSGAQPRSLYLTIYCKKHNLGTQWNRDSLKPKLAVKIGAAIGRLIGT